MNLAKVVWKYLYLYLSGEIVRVSGCTRLIKQHLVFFLLAPGGGQGGGARQLLPSVQEAVSRFVEHRQQHAAGSESKGPLISATS